MHRLRVSVAIAVGAGMLALAAVSAATAITYYQAGKNSGTKPYVIITVTNHNNVAGARWRIKEKCDRKAHHRRAREHWSTDRQQGTLQEDGLLGLLGDNLQRNGHAKKATVKIHDTGPVAPYCQCHGTHTFHAKKL